MGYVDYQPNKEYEISGINVNSEIIKDELLPDASARVVVVKSSCQSERWGIRAQTHSITIYNHTSLEDPAKSLEQSRHHAAELLAKTELGEIPEKGISVMGVEIHGPTGKKINAIAIADIGISPTLLGREIIDVLTLESAGKHYFQESGVEVKRVPLFKARIGFGPYECETLIAPSDHGSPACILGGDFFQKLLLHRQELIQELLMPDHYRTLANAARCKRKYVLIAGAYGEHRPRLIRIKEKLKSLGFEGLVLDEYPDIEEQPLAEKMVTYASICRFVIVDDFAPSGHINELGICHERKFVTGVLRFRGRPTYDAG
jgi:hypothetical protein